MGVTSLPKSVIIQWLQNKVQTQPSIQGSPLSGPSIPMQPFLSLLVPQICTVQNGSHHFYVEMKQWKCGCCELTSVVSSIYISDFEDEMPKKGCNISQYFLIDYTQK